MTADPIVVGYDGSQGSRAAVRWALDEAARTGVPVQLVSIFEWLTGGSWMGPGPGPGTFPDEIPRREAEQELRAALAEAHRTHPDVTVDGEVIDGPPTLRLQDRSERASMVVLGSRGHGGFTGLLTGSTTVAVSAHAHCPVVVVRGADQLTGARSSGEVVVGVDGSPESLLALEFALRQADGRRVPLRVLRAWHLPISAWNPPNPGWNLVVPPGAPPGAPLGIDPEQIRRTEREALDETLAERIRAYPEVDLRPEVVLDSPAGALIDATGSAQLVVVGSRGRGGFRGLLLGSVSQQVMHHSACPVAVVRDLGRQADPGETLGHRADPEKGRQ